MLAYPALLDTISKELRRADVKKLKVFLSGHVNRESIETITTGRDLLRILQTRGLVAENKLAFLRKLLADVNLMQLALLIDGFKDDKSRLNLNQGQVNKEQTRKEEALRKLAIRQGKEIDNFESDKQAFNKQLGENEAMIDSQKERLIYTQDIIDNLDDKLLLIDSEIVNIRDRIQESDEVIKRQEKQLKKLEHSLGKTITLPKGPAKPVAKKKPEGAEEEEEGTEKKSDAEREAESKLITIEKLRQENQEMRVRYDDLLTERREINAGLVEKTSELVDTDQHMLRTLDEMRKVKKQLKNTQFNIDELTDRRIETIQDFETLKDMTAKEFIERSLPRKNQPTPSYPPNKVLNYDKLRQLDAVSIGCQGNRSNPPQFTNPQDVACNEQGHILVADHGNCCIHFLDITGLCLREPLYLEKTRPTAIAINKSGQVIVTDGQMISVFTADGTHSHNFLPVYNRNDVRPQIVSLAVDQDDGLYLCDQSNHRIQHFKTDGTFRELIGSRAYIDTPAGVAVKQNGDLIVSEYHNHRLKILPKGRIQAALGEGIIGREGAGIGQYKSPQGLALDSAGNILISDRENHRVQVLNNEGQFIASFGKFGTGPGCLDAPTTLTVNHHGHVIVVDSGNHRINLYS